MSHNYILSVLTIAHLKVDAHRRRQLNIIQEAYDLCKGIPPERWGPKVHDPEFNRTTLFGHYAHKRSNGTNTVSNALVYSAPLRTALNDFTTCEFDIGVVLEGIPPGPVPMADPQAAIPDYKLIAMSLLRAILLVYAPTTSRKSGRSHLRKDLTKQFDGVRQPYKD